MSDNKNATIMPYMTPEIADAERRWREEHPPGGAPQPEPPAEEQPEPV